MRIQFLITIFCLAIAGCTSPKSSQTPSAALDTGNSIDRDAIDAVIKTHRSDIHECLASALKINPKWKGKIIAQFIIGMTGKASHLGISESSVESAEVELCVLTVVSKIDFPKPTKDPITIKYPVGFR